MNTLIANQYGRVQGEAGGCGLTLCVTAQTPRRESVELQTLVDAIEQQLHLLAILRAVERRIEQFQLRDSKAGESAEQRVLSTRPSAAKRICFARIAPRRRTKFTVAFPSSSFTNRWTIGRRIGNRERLWLTCGCSIQTTAAPIRDWFFRPEKLRELGIPDALIEAAAKSDPQGFLLFDNLPDQTEPATGHANQTTTDESAT